MLLKFVPQMPFRHLINFIQVDWDFKDSSHFRVKRRACLPRSLSNTMRRERILLQPNVLLAHGHPPSKGLLRTRSHLGERAVAVEASRQSPKPSDRHYVDKKSAENEPQMPFRKGICGTILSSISLCGTHFLSQSAPFGSDSVILKLF